MDRADKKKRLEFVGQPQHAAFVDASYGVCECEGCKLVEMDAAFIDMSCSQNEGAQIRQDLIELARQNTGG